MTIPPTEGRTPETLGPNTPVPLSDRAVRSKSIAMVAVTIVIVAGIVFLALLAAVTWA